MNKTTLKIPKMDCASEEQLIRLRLEALKNISAMDFDLSNRRMDIYHTGDIQTIMDAIDGLHLETTLVESAAVDEWPTFGGHQSERRLLLQVLLINFFFFLLETATGFISNSMGLVADGLDMLADSLVYGLAILAVGGTPARKKSVAKASGYFQLILAVFGVVEVIRRFLGFGGIPIHLTMILVSVLALIGNATCLALLQKSKSNDAHMQASRIFTSNDVIINLGVILAGVLVFATRTKVPDLIVGAIVFVIVARGSIRLLQIAR